jgi:small subunit ribosomal protein S16
MVRIRLRRVGLRNQPSYRVIVADQEAPRDGRFLEIVGFYNPRTEPATVELDEVRIFEWMRQGAQPSDSVVQIFNSIKLMDRFARFKAGEASEALAAEAKALVESRATEMAARKAAKK